MGNFGGIFGALMVLYGLGICLLIIGSYLARPAFAYRYWETYPARRVRLGIIVIFLALGCWIGAQIGTLLVYWQSF
jgi:hypothetical protein